MVEENRSLIIIAAHHYVLKDTTVASGEWEGMRPDPNGGWQSWYHGTPENQVPRSWLLTFTEGSDEVHSRCYLHADGYAPQGWYDKVARTIKLPRPFRMPGEHPS